MTYSFIQAIERGHGTTYGNMLNSMRSTIKNVEPADGGIVTSLLTMLLTGGSLSGGLRQVCLLLLLLSCLLCMPGTVFFFHVLALES